MNRSSLSTNDQTRTQFAANRSTIIRMIVVCSLIIFSVVLLYLQEPEGARHTISQSLSLAQGRNEIEQSIVKPTLLPKDTPTPAVQDNVATGKAITDSVTSRNVTEKTSTNNTGDARQSPYVGAPICPSHNNTQWHGLWDAARGCHYDHTHNADPNQVAANFGEAGQQAGGQTISYVWETHHENHLKHQGYKYAVGSNLPCAQDNYHTFNANIDCVRAFRVQYHNVGGPLDGVVRFHSFYAEVEVCKKGTNVCGIIRTGGRSDFGILQAPYKMRWVPVPGMDPTMLAGLTWQTVGDKLDLNLDPYRAFSDLRDVETLSAEWATCKDCAGAGRELRTTWAAANKFGGSPWSQSNKMASFKFWTFDDWGGFNPENARDYRFVCPDGSCRFNSSEHALYEMNAFIPAELDEDGDGIVNYVGYTDLDGNIVTTCRAPGRNCVPLVIEHAPVGDFIYSFQAPYNNIDLIKQDFDQSPEGVWWIEYPN